MGKTAAGNCGCGLVMCWWCHLRKVIRTYPWKTGQDQVAAVVAGCHKRDLGPLWRARTWSFHVSFGCQAHLDLDYGRFSNSSVKEWVRKGLGKGKSEMGEATARMLCSSRQWGSFLRWQFDGGQSCLLWWLWRGWEGKHITFDKTISSKHLVTNGVVDTDRLTGFPV